MSSASPSSLRDDSIFTSYVALANGLVANLNGHCLLTGSLAVLGQQGHLAAEQVTRWLRTLGWTDSLETAPAAFTESRDIWSGIPLRNADGALLGVFCVSQPRAGSSSSPSHIAADLATRLKPLLDCINRDLTNASPSGTKLQGLTERSAELEWLFEITSKHKGAVDDKKVLQELLTEAASRLHSALGVLYVPHKRLTVKVACDAAAAPALSTAWTQTREQLIAWVQRHNRPLVVNNVGKAEKRMTQCKVMCLPVTRQNSRVIGALAFYNLPEAPDFSNRQVFVARYIGRQAASILEAQFDLMTGLYTRSGLDQMYLDLPEDPEPADSSVIYLDIDHMHVVNELHGFELGNELIVRVADLLTAPLLPEGALAARISGDRFIVVLPRSTSAEAIHIAQTLQGAAERLVIGAADDAFDVSVSCGVSALIPMPEGLARAIAAAEVACKTAKSHGRNRVELYAFEDGSMMRRHGDALAVGRLRSALKSDRLLLYAQRIAPLQDPSLPGGYELLLRLRNVDGTLESPGQLVEAAQRYQLLPSVDRWVVQRALQMLAPYRSMLATRGLGMSINVSGQSIGDETFIQQFAQLLREANLPRNCIDIELTEQAAVTNLASAKLMVTKLAELGCRFALDDFGTGANSLTYLKALQVNRVKIDGSFVRDVLSDRNSRATVKAIVELAKGLGIETVAEHVENDAIAQEVRRLGVSYAQGYAFARPEPLSEVLEGLVHDESKRLHMLFLES